MNQSARFLLLFDEAARALLLDRDRRLMGEVIEDDGFIVDTLLRTATPCAVPSDALAAHGHRGSGRCFDLG